MVKNMTKNKKDIILNFYKDNPQLFFLKENYEEPPFHQPYIPDDPSQRVINEPAVSFEKDKDETQPLTKTQLNSIKPVGKFSSALKKIGLAAATTAITVIMMAKACDIDKNPNNETNQSDLASVEEILSVTPEIKKADVKDLLNQELSISYETEIDEDEIIYDILGHEGYEAFPYPDVKQWSVGYGTKVSDKPAASLSNKTKAEVSQLRKTWKRKKSISKKALSDWISTQYPNWREDFYDKYNISQENRQKDSKATGISQESSYEATDKVFGNILRRLRGASYEFSDSDSFQYWDKAPSHVKKVLIDLSYNMGLGVLKKFKEFNKNLGFALSNLDKSVVKEEDIQNAEIGIQNAAKELLNNFDENDEIEGKTSYYSQNKKRAKANFEILANTPIDRTEFRLVKKESKSLLDVYNHLFS